MTARRWISTLALGVAVALPSAGFAPEKETAGTAGGTMDKAVEKTKETAGTAGEAITDAWITTEIKAHFIDEDTLKGSDINVDTSNHIVTLNGTVASLAGKTRAEQVAKSTKGVTRVVNKLTLATKTK